MKTLAAHLIASLLLSVITFTAGVLGASVYLSAPEHASIGTTSDISDLWTNEPTIVRRDQEQLERVAARVAALSYGRSANSSEPVEQATALLDEDLDGLTTGATVDAGEKPDLGVSSLSHEHAQWCTARYNSYRDEDGTYQPYDGERRRCVSPYIEVNSGTLVRSEGAAEEVLLSARRALGDNGVNRVEVAADLDDHVYNCSKRYRSYRPEDNSYQPFDGGPRRKCR